MKKLFLSLTILFFALGSSAQFNSSPWYIVRNQFGAGRSTMVPASAYAAFGPDGGAVKGILPPPVDDTNAISGTKRDGLFIYSKQLGGYARWDSAAGLWVQPGYGIAGNIYSINGIIPGATNRIARLGDGSSLVFADSASYAEDDESFMTRLSQTNGYEVSVPAYLYGNSNYISGNDLSIPGLTTAPANSRIVFVNDSAGGKVYSSPVSSLFTNIYNSDGFQSSTYRDYGLRNSGLINGERQIAFIDSALVHSRFWPSTAGSYFYDGYAAALRLTSYYANTSGSGATFSTGPVLTGLWGDTTASYKRGAISAIDMQSNPYGGISIKSKSAGWGGVADGEVNISIQSSAISASFDVRDIAHKAYTFTGGKMVVDSVLKFSVKPSSRPSAADSALDIDNDGVVYRKPISATGTGPQILLSNATISAGYDTVLRVIDDSTAVLKSLYVRNGLSSIPTDSSIEINLGGALTKNTALTLGAYTLSTDSSVFLGGAKMGSGPVSKNIAIGTDVLKTATNSTSVPNVGVGEWSLRLNQAARGNTGVGSYTLSNTTSGEFNTAVGSTSLFMNTTGQGNTGVGYRSLRYNTTGNGNIAQGESSLQNNVIGSFNTGIGSGAGPMLGRTGVAADNNTFIGYNAGPVFRDGDNNTIIGANVTGTDSTHSNKVMIGSGDGQVLLHGTTNSTDDSLRVNARLSIALMDSTAAAATNMVTWDRSTGKLRPVPVPSGGGGGVSSGTLADRLAIGSPTNGQQFYQTDADEGLWVFTRNRWSKIADGRELLNEWTGIGGTSATLAKGGYGVVTNSGTGAGIGHNNASWYSDELPHSILSTGTTATGRSVFMYQAGTSIGNVALFNKGGGDGSAFYTMLGGVVLTGPRSDGTDAYVVTFGMHDNNSTIVPTNNGIYFRYSDTANSGQWTCVARARGGGETVVNTTHAPRVHSDSTATGINGQDLAIWVNAADSSARFYINDTLVATITGGAYIPVTNWKSNSPSITLFNPWRVGIFKTAGVNSRIMRFRRAYIVKTR